MLTRLKYHSKKKRKKTDLGIKERALKLDNYNSVAFHIKQLITKKKKEKKKKFVPVWQKSFHIQ